MMMTKADKMLIILMLTNAEIISMILKAEKMLMVLMLTNAENMLMVNEDD